ncbi:immunity protein YezG family protein [Oceanirhabdus sp. W0125-5]|uniref:immunity protein YezG family protein n=1 Tax=Oceanirhabdus sp. W0125-5 TaxID=2999116 RepID=UPI0022F30447|nr:immunity protein YezG family protein [Oceanirhabdus sp. W0125-5]WBW95936.1 DUF600 family protein [Oceanirhabdus sp. W0125-5]
MNLNEEYYREIAQELINIVPENWEQIHLRTEVGEESVSMYFYYRLTGSSEYEQGAMIRKKYNLERSVYKKFVSDLCSVIRRLNDNYVKNGQEKWTAMTFSIDNSFKFKVDYEYLDLSSSLEVDRREEWEKKYLI